MGFTKTIEVRLECNWGVRWAARRLCRHPFCYRRQLCLGWGENLMHVHCSLNIVHVHVHVAISLLKKKHFLSIKCVCIVLQGLLCLLKPIEILHTLSPAELFFIYLTATVSLFSFHTSYLGKPPPKKKQSSFIWENNFWIRSDWKFADYGLAICP